jgi:plastocyanin
MKTYVRLLFLALLAGVFLEFAARGATYTIRIQNFFFTPTNLLINPSDRVQWVNGSMTVHDIMEGTTNTSAGQRLFYSGNLAANASYTFTFTNAGFYHYFCSNHLFNTLNPLAIRAEQTGTVTVTTANLPPVTALTGPTNNVRLTNAFLVAMAASAEDTIGGVAKVEFYVNGQLSGVDTSSPYSTIASSLLAGTNVLTAVAYDNLGLAATSAPVNIVVTNFATTNLVLMQNTAFSPKTITVTAGSTIIWTNLDLAQHTATGFLTNVEPICGPRFMSAGQTCTNRFMTPGVYPYYCVPHSTFLMFGTVIVASAVSSPLASLTKPTPGSAFLTNSLIAFEATASDASGITNVQFFRAPDTLLGDDVSAPYQISSTLPVGTHNVFARAFDAQGFGRLTPQSTLSVIAGSAPRILAPDVSSGSMKFQITTTPGLSYVVESASGLPGSFQPVTTNMATGATLLFTDPSPASQTQRLYRAFIK